MDDARKTVILGLAPRIHPVDIAFGMGQMDPRGKPEGDDLGGGTGHAQPVEQGRFYSVT